MKRLNKLIDLGFCLGCGLCESIATSDKCVMKLHENGFYYPLFKKKLTKDEISTILSCCPAINITGNGEKSVWGRTKSVTEAWASNSTLRKAASSGGVVSALAVYLLQKKEVDGILHVGVKEDSFLYNELKISRTDKEVLMNVGSRYAPSLVFDRIRQILDASDDVFAFVGKPCDIAGIKNYCKRHQQYSNRIKFFIGIFCAGIPSFKGTQKLIELSKSAEEPVSLKYRGDGWPGMFEVQYKSGPTFKASYNDSWRNVLSKHVGLRCRICPDGIGLLADIVVGDAWNTKNGYPDFEEKEGKSFVLVRTSRGEELFKGAIEEKLILNNSLELSKISDMQRYQHNRRLLAGYRLIAVQLFSWFLFNFRKLGIWRLLLQANIKSGIYNMFGTLKRLLYKRSRPS